MDRKIYGFFYDAVGFAIVGSSIASCANHDASAPGTKPTRP